MGDGETFDESSDEEEKKEQKFFEEINKLKNPLDELTKPKEFNFKEIMVKGSKIEVEIIEEMRMTNKLFLIHARKEVKNQNIVKNLMSAFENRYVGIVNFKDPLATEKKDSYHLVVLSQISP